jgi:hypothetical protein
MWDICGGGDQRPLQKATIHFYIHKLTSNNTDIVRINHTSHIVLSDTIQYNTIQYNKIEYNTIQYNTIQYNTFYSSELFRLFVVDDDFCFLTSSYSDTPLLVRLLWTRDRPVSQTSIWQHTTLNKRQISMPRQESNPQSQLSELPKFYVGGRGECDITVIWVWYAVKQLLPIWRCLEPICW